MPKWITNQQVKIYMEERKKKTQKIAAAKAGFSERSARNLEKRGFAICRKERTWKTREDPFEGIWEEFLLPKLEENHNLQAKTLYELLQEKYPKLFGIG